MVQDEGHCPIKGDREEEIWILARTAKSYHLHIVYSLWFLRGMNLCDKN